MMNMRSKKIQTGLRLPELLINQLKTKARQEGKSFNAYVEEVLERDVALVFPKLKREDFQPDEELMAMGLHIPEFTKEDLENDPRLAHILGWEGE